MLAVIGAGVTTAPASAAPAVAEHHRVSGLPPADSGTGASEKRPFGVNAEYGPFNVRAQNSNKCLDVKGGTGSLDDGVPVQIWDCYGAAQTNQQWYFRDTGDQFVYNLVVRHSGKCLDINGGTGAVENGRHAQQWGCLGYYQTNQKWYLSSYTLDGRTIYQLNAMHSGKCLDVRGGTGAIDNGTPVQQWDCLGNQQTNQHWYLTAP